jgi:hypothetical protein
LDVRGTGVQPVLVAGSQWAFFSTLYGLNVTAFTRI